MRFIFAGILLVSLGGVIGGVFINQSNETGSYPKKSLASPVTRCLNLGNALDAPNEGDWTYRIEDEHLKVIADAGFQTVRIPVRWSAHAQTIAPYSIDPVFFDRVEHVVNVALEHGLKVILDVHHYEEIMASPENHTERLTVLWQQIATRFRGHGDRIVFEILNEANDNLTNDKLEKINTSLVATIRNIVGSDPWIIVGGDLWGNFEGIENAQFPSDPRLIMTFHDYGPFEFTHQGASFTVQDYPVGQVWGSEKEKQRVSDLFSAAKNLSAQNQLPVFLGEFGVIRGVPADQRANYIEYYRRAAEQTDIGWCLWDFGASFSIYDVETKQWSQPVLDALLRE